MVWSTPDSINPLLTMHSELVSFLLALYGELIQCVGINPFLTMHNDGLTLCSQCSDHINPLLTIYTDGLTLSTLNVWCTHRSLLHSQLVNLTATRLYELVLLPIYLSVRLLL